MGLDDRLRRLETRHTPHPGGDERPNDTSELFELQMEFYRAGDSRFVYDEQERAFYSKDGRLVLSETYVNIPAWFA